MAGLGQRLRTRASSTAVIVQKRLPARTKIRPQKSCRPHNRSTAYPEMDRVVPQCMMSTPRRPLAISQSCNIHPTGCERQGKGSPRGIPQDRPDVLCGITCHRWRDPQDPISTALDSMASCRLHGRLGCRSHLLVQAGPHSGSRVAIGTRFDPTSVVFR